MKNTEMDASEAFEAALKQARLDQINRRILKLKLVIYVTLFALGIAGIACIWIFSHPMVALGVILVLAANNHDKVFP